MATNTINVQPDCPFDDDYLARLRNDDPETAEHFNRYFRRLLGIMLCGAFSHQQTQDLIDEVMFAVITNIMRGQPRDSAKLISYVRGVCSNLRNRTIRNRVNRPQEVEIELDRLTLRGDTAAERLLKQETEKKIQKVLRELSARDRNILTDLFYNELTRDEVCAKYPPLTRDQLKMILFHARQRFQKWWKKNEEEGQHGPEL
jgi:RNA polymerase sigma factor (sigma-70 family)